MHISLRNLSALCAFFVLLVGLSACGGDSLPGNSVAKIDDRNISKDEFNHWLGIAARSQTPPGQTPTSLPDAPNFTKCIADKRKGLPKPPKGQKGPTDKQLKDACAQEYKAYRDQALLFLINAEWVAREAKDQKVSVADKDVDKRLAEVKKQSFPKAKDFEKYMTQVGYKIEDVNYQLKSQMLSAKLRDKAVKGKKKATEAQITAYYNKNKARFATAERRDLVIVLTKDKAKAEAARKALEGGQSFKAVAKKFSIDQASKSTGGKLPGVQKGQQEAAFDTAVFGAKKGELTGPVKTQFGYYVFKVEKIYPADQQTKEEARKQIVGLVEAENENKAFQDFLKDYRKRWREKTICRKEYAIADCKNAPKTKTTTTAAPAGQNGQG